MTNTNVLIVEDDESVARFLEQAVTEAGYSAESCADGILASEKAETQGYDLILLDIMLPGRNGFEVCRHLRAMSVATPILLITAKDTLEDKIEGLDSGADDYIVKPYDIRNLMARVRAVMRRARAPETGSSLVHGPLVLHVEGRVATWHGELVPLTKKEYWLLEAMLRQRSRVLSRAQLEDALYGWGEETGSNTIEVYIHHLRRKFCNELIITIRGLGYQICAESVFAQPEGSPA